MRTFEPEKIRAFSPVATLHWRSELDSTNEEAKRLLAGDQPNTALPCATFPCATFPCATFPLLVLCDLQTAGRGQPGRNWFSDRQSLTFTWVVEAGLMPQNVAAILPLLSGAAICRALANLGIDRPEFQPQLKWPNDVLLDQHKVCGILVEKIHVAKQNFYLIGVGINVNQAFIPNQGARFEPASLKQIAGREFPIMTVLERCLESLATCWEALSATGSGEGISAESKLEPCRKWFAFQGKQIEFEPADGQPIRGVFRGVNDSGFLLLEVENELHAFSSGRILRAFQST